MESRKKNVARETVPEAVRKILENAWKEERKERIKNTTTALGFSFAATYVFGLVGLAGYFNWVDYSIASYSKFFFNASLFGAAATWHYHNERNALIKKKSLSEQEIYETYMKMKAAKQFQANQV